MADQQAHARGWRWPKGIVNRLLLVAASVGLLADAGILAGYLFFGRSRDFPEPWSRDIAVRAVLLAFLLALFLVPFSRRRYRLFLPAHLLGGLTELLHSTALWLPAPWLGYAPVAWSLLSCATGALWVAALTHGERWDEFVLTAPLALLAALFPRQLGDAAAEWPPLLDEQAAGDPGVASQAPRTTEGG